MPDLRNGARIKFVHPIASCDARLIRLLNQRARHVRRILKQAPNLKVQAEEVRTLKKIVKFNPGPLSNKALVTIYKKILHSNFAKQSVSSRA